ncbi:ankyrin repeat domain-containing protein [Candidatus Thiothrix anitrata]|jgi:hypothetical protein|uniref:Ankyrin repeat domain-containing protein n=1 Tax=Candidatus Thiothrix anitrata TaxID=2823902 RepID=A0ABX7X627_9GAMM|nr:ankyrin repeat domain-containing protein [Candidatus Thiothrix anitrata]QTR51076.1 ankyrin repeat domain-containing protein [Candidatus Thiothrix anitrata]
MHIKQTSLAAAVLVALIHSPALLAEGFDDIFTPHATATPAVAEAVAAPITTYETATMPLATPDGFMPDPTTAVAPVANADGYMPDPTAAAPAQPEVPQLSQEEKDSRFWLAAREGNTVEVAEMLRQGANPNTVNNNGATAIHGATQYGSLPLVMYLHRSGVNINTTTTNGWTAIHTAARFGKADIANYLKQQGLNPNIPTSDFGKTPVQMALDNGDLRTARILGY